MIFDIQGTIEHDHIPMGINVRLLLPRRLNPGVRRLPASEAVAYLKQVVAPELGINGPGEFEPLLEDATITVIRWQTETGETFYARFWGGRQQWNPVLQHLGAAREFQAAGLTVPPVVFADRSRSTALRWGFESTVEASAPNVAMTSECGGRELPLLARDLARLHARRSERWGRPWIPGSSAAAPPRSSWRNRLKAFRKRITPQTTGLKAEEIEDCLARLEQGMDRQAGFQPALIHGDLFRGHVYVGEDNNLTWIDLETVEYGLPEWDLGNVRLWLDAGEFEAFLRSYEEARGEAFEPGRIMTAGLFAQMKRLYKRVRQARVSREKQERGEKADSNAPSREKVEQALREILARGL